MKIAIRSATPADAIHAAPLLYSSGPAAFEYVFGPACGGDVISFLVWAFASGRGELGYPCHVVAVANGTVVGLGAHFSGNDTLRFMAGGTIQMLQYFGPEKAAGIVRRALQLERIVRPPSRRLHYIAHLGVNPQQRGMGIGAQLVRHLLDEGLRRGRTIAALDVAATNPRARALYERLGFRETAIRRSALRNGFGTVADHIRMERRLIEVTPAR